MVVCSKIVYVYSINILTTIFITILITVLLSRTGYILVDVRGKIIVKHP